MTRIDETIASYLTALQIEGKTCGARIFGPVSRLRVGGVP